MDTRTMTAIVRNANKILSVSWRAVYEEKKDELTRMFAEIGDGAYGVWIQQFMAPVFERLKADGYTVKAGFNRHDSVENWGPPEERERCAWYVIHDADGMPLGTMILQVYHSHRTFHMPRAPRLLALDAVDREAILAALGSASTRVRWDLKEERLPGPDQVEDAGTRWEYATDVALADSLCMEGGDASSWLLDEALSHWGRYGWELVSVTPLPAGNRVVAYFKRPCRA